MKITYILFLISIVLISCQSEKKQLQTEIQQLESTTNSNPSDGQLDSLMVAYQHYISAFPEDKAQISTYQKNAQALLDTRLTALRKETFNETTGVLNEAAVKSFIELAEKYAALAPDSEKAPEWLYEAAELAGSMHDYDKALALFQTISEKFPNYPKASQVLFMRAFTLDSELKRYDDAKILYQEFLQKYPSDEFADDAQFLLENLGKSEEEIIRGFQAKQK